MAEKKVILFRSPFIPESEDEYHKALLPKGFSPVSIPVLSFEFQNLDKLENLLNQPEKHNGIILTSQRAVEAIELAVQNIKSNWTEQLQKEWQSLHLFAVGEATYKSLNDKLGLTCSGCETGNAENLVPIIKEAISSYEKPLLFPCGNLRKDTIPVEMERAGIQLENIEVYKTCAHPEIKKNLQEFLQFKGHPSVLVFFSPSGLVYSLDILKELLGEYGDIKMIAIGNTTLKAMGDDGLSVAGVAQKPNPESLCRCIEECFLSS